MMKNIMILVTVAVLGGSQVAGMDQRTLSKRVKTDEMSSQNVSKVGIKFGKEEIKKIINSAKKNALNKEENINLLAPANKGMQELGKLLQTKKIVTTKESSSILNNLDKLNEGLKKATELLAKRSIIEETVYMPKKQHAVLIPEVETKKQGFFGSLWNKIKNNKGKIATGVVGMTLLAGAAYYMLSNPVSTINVVAQPVSSAFKSCYSHSYELGASIPSNICYYAAEFNKNFQNIIL